MVNHITYKLNRVVHIEGHQQTPFSCAHCGYAGLKNIYYLMGSDNIEILVGSECAPHLLSGQDLKEFQNADVNLKKATREWKKQFPPPFPNETREGYINRRLSELPNAPKAQREWLKIRIPHHTAQERLTLKGIENPANYTMYGANRHYRDLNIISHSDSNVNNGHSNYIHNCPLCKQQKDLAKTYDQLTYIEMINMVKEIAYQYHANPYDLVNILLWESRIEMT